MFTNWAKKVLVLSTINMAPYNCCCYWPYSMLTFCKLIPYSQLYNAFVLVQDNFSSKFCLHLVKLFCLPASPQNLESFVNSGCGFYFFGFDGNCAFSVKANWRRKKRRTGLYATDREQAFSAKMNTYSFLKHMIQSYNIPF